MLMVVLKKFTNYFDFQLYYFILMFDVECSILIPEKHGCEGKRWS